MTTLTVAGGAPCRGTLRVPGDKSISHRGLLLAALADGASHLRGLSAGDDVRRSAAAMAALGARIAPGPTSTVVEGAGGGLHAPAAPLDMGNSGTGLRLVAGLVAGWPWPVELTGDASLSARPMDRIAGPLRLMGARVEGRGERCLPPITVHGGELRGIDYTTPMASAQVKSCLLLAGLRAAGETVVREPVATRRHTEELLARCGVPVDEADEGGCRVVRVRAATPSPFELTVPGDPSQAAFWIVAACIVPGSELTVRGVYVGPARRGFVDVLRRMGATVAEVPVTGGDDLAATADLTVSAAGLTATDIGAAEIPSLDEVPVLAVAAARAEGTTVFHDVGELRVKESDRLAGVARMVRAFGASAEVSGDDLAVTGVAELRPARIDAGGDHRMAMAAAVAGLACPPGAPTRIDGWESVATSYPGFEADLDRLRAGR